MILSFCFLQVIKTFHIHDLFCEAVNVFPDIIKESFPFLLKNKPLESKIRNVSKLMTNAFHHSMIYITHLYQARLMMMKLKPNDSIPTLNFEMYPIVKEIFTGIKNHLHKLSLGSETVTEDKKKHVNPCRRPVIKKKSVMVCKKGSMKSVQWQDGLRECRKTWITLERKWKF